VGYWAPFRGGTGYDSDAALAHAAAAGSLLG
jgi:hypothetical protein